MSKYQSGIYHIALFDRMGSRIRTETADSYLSALREAKVWLGRSEAHSFAISRVLFNSLERAREKWEVQNHEQPR